MQRRHTIDRVAAHTRQVRHAHGAVAAFINQRQTLHSALVPGIALPYVVQEAPVDLVDNLQMSR